MSFTSRNGNTIIECGYDYQGRRYVKKVTQNGTVTSHERYLYRGYLQIAALDMLDNRNVLRTLLWNPLEPVPPPSPGAGRFPLLLWHGLQQECDGGLRCTISRDFLSLFYYEINMYYIFIFYFLCYRNW